MRTTLLLTLLLAIGLSINAQDTLRYNNKGFLSLAQPNPTAQLNIFGTVTPILTVTDQWQVCKQIKGLIETDGHLFKNDTCKSPIMYYANYDKVLIRCDDTNTEYTHRECKIKGCKILHLEEVSNIFQYASDGIGRIYLNNTVK
jgi:hypothetical protein